MQWDCCWCVSEWCDWLLVLTNSLGLIKYFILWSSLVCLVFFCFFLLCQWESASFLFTALTWCSQKGIHRTKIIFLSAFIFCFYICVTIFFLRYYSLIDLQCLCLVLLSQDIMHFLCFSSRELNTLIQAIYVIGCYFTNHRYLQMLLLNVFWGFTLWSQHMIIYLGTWSNTARTTWYAKSIVLWSQCEQLCLYTS